MKFLHYEFDLTHNDCVQVRLDKQANVVLLDTSNFQKYRSGSRYSYYGGLAKRSPFNLSPPCSGRWHLVIDTGGYGGTVRASVNVI
jgi:hypothetical protein